MSDGINIGSIVADLDVNSGRMVQGLANGRQALDAIDRELKQLDRDMKGGAIGSGEHAARVAELNRTLADLAAKMQTAHAAVNVTNGGLDVLSARMTQGANSTGRMGQALMQLGYMADDAQYGIGALVNNVAPLIYNLGGSAGIAAVAQVAAVALNQLVIHFDDLQELFGASKTQTQAEEMAELRKQTELTAAAAEKLYRYEQLRSKGKELATAKTTSEAKAEDIATKAIVEAGVKDVVGGVRKNAPELLESGEGVQAAKKARDDIKDEQVGHIDARTGERIVGPGEAEAHRGRLLEAEKKYADALDHAAAQIVASGALPQIFPQNAGKLAGLVAKHPGDFGPHENQLQAGLEESQRQAQVTPEQRQKAKVGKVIGKAIDDILDGFRGAVEKQVKADARDAKEAEREADKATREQIQALNAWKRVAWADVRKEQREQGRDAKEQDREIKRAHREAVEKAETVPGAKPLAAKLAAQQMMGNLSEDEAAIQLGRALRGAVDENGKRIMNDDETMWATHQLLKEGKQSVTNRLDHLGGDSIGDGRPASKSEIYGVSDIAHRVQSAISDKPSRHETKMETLQEKANHLLETLANKPGLTYKIT